MQPGDVVTVEFPGITGVKRRPAVIISTDMYHRSRPDVILALLTTQLADATAPTDYILQDWAQAGLHRPSAVRMFLATLPAKAVTVIGHLSDRDWQEVQQRLRLALAVA